MVGRLIWTQPPSEPSTDAELARLTRLVADYETNASEPLGPEALALPFEMACIPLYPIVGAGNLASAGDWLAAIAQTRAVARHLPRASWLVTNADRLHKALLRRHIEEPVPAVPQATLSESLCGHPP